MKLLPLLLVASLVVAVMADFAGANPTDDDSDDANAIGDDDLLDVDMDAGDSPDTDASLGADATLDVDASLDTDASHDASAHASLDASVGADASAHKDASKDGGDSDDAADDSGSAKGGSAASEGSLLGANAFLAAGFPRGYGGGSGFPFFGPPGGNWYNNFIPSGGFGGFAYDDVYPDFDIGITSYVGGGGVNVRERMLRRWRKELRILLNANENNVPAEVIYAMIGERFHRTPLSSVFGFVFSTSRGRERMSELLRYLLGALF